MLVKHLSRGARPNDYKKNNKKKCFSTARSLVLREAEGTLWTYHPDFLAAAQSRQAFGRATASDVIQTDQAFDFIKAAQLCGCHAAVIGSLTAKDNILAVSLQGEKNTGDETSAMVSPIQRPEGTKFIVALLFCCVAVLLRGSDYLFSLLCS